MELALGLGTVDTIGRAHQANRRVKHKTEEARPTEWSTRYDSIPADDSEQPMSVGKGMEGGAAPTSHFTDTPYGLS
jgi:hypothetical protein